MRIQAATQANPQSASVPPIKILVSRPATAPADRPPEVHGPECCWTTDGEIVIPALVGCDPRPGHAEWGFIGMTSARAATWAVVETRSLGEVVAAVVGGQYAADGGEEDDFPGFVFDDIRQVGRCIRDLPAGSVVGISGPTQQAYRLYDRTMAAQRKGS